jgi:hypothetical protein
MLSRTMKPVNRDSLMALLKHQGLDVEEVTDDNVATMRALSAKDLKPGSIVWQVRDPVSRGITKVVVVYSEPGRPVPYRGGVRAPRANAFTFGNIVIDDHGARICLRTDDGVLLRLNGV